MPHLYVEYTDNLAGPGASAFVWANPRLINRFWQPLSGWFGHAEPFKFVPDYHPAQGIQRYLCGTQPMVSRSEEHTSELQSPCNLVCRLLLEKKKAQLRR